MKQVRNTRSRRRATKMAMGPAKSKLVAFLLEGREGRTRGLKLKGWAKCLAHEVRRRAKRSARLDRQVFYRLVDRVADQYRTMKVVKAQDLHRLSKDLKGTWATLGLAVRARVSRAEGLE